MGNATAAFTTRLLHANRTVVSFAARTTQEGVRSDCRSSKRSATASTPQQMFGTLDAIKRRAGARRFQFRASNRWLDGAHNRTAIKGFYGAGQEDASRAEEFALDAGEPAVLLGTDTGPNPAEALLHALAACLTTSLVYVAAARSVRLTEVESTLEGDMDVRGCLGISDEVRNGFDAHPRALPRQGRRAGRRSCARSSSARSSGRPSSTWSATASRSTVGSGVSRRSPMLELARQTAEARRASGRPRRALAEDLATRAADHDRDGELPAREHRRAAARRLLRGADPGQLRRAGRRVGPRPARRREPAGARRRVGRDRREHAHGRRCCNIVRRWQMAVAARPRAARRGLRGVDASDRPRRRRDRRRRSASRAGPHAPGDDRDPHGRRAGASTAARCSARCRPRRPCSTPR